ncbi:MAG: T9SS type A sorting domain-containing protein, partial [Salibacteraceae bacterium]
AQGMVQIQSETLGQHQLQLHDLTGRQVYTETFRQSLQISTEDLSPGVYLMAIEQSGKSVETHRLVIQ